MAARCALYISALKIYGIVEGPMSSRKNLMLIFGNWLDCVLEGIILQKKYVAIFYNYFLVLFCQI